MRKFAALFVVLVTVLGIAGVAWAATPGVSKDEIKLGVTYSTSTRSATSPTSATATTRPRTTRSSTS